MATQVSLTDITGSGRATENRAVERNLRIGSDSYANSLKVKENRFVDLYFDKVSERQVQATIQRRQDDLMAHTESLTRPEPNAAEHSRAQQRSQAENGNRDGQREDTIAKNGDKLPGDDVHRSDSERQTSLRQDSQNQDSLRKDAPAKDETSQSKDEAAGDVGQKYDDESLNAVDEASSSGLVSGDVLLAGTLSEAGESSSETEDSPDNEKHSQLADETEEFLEFDGGGVTDSPPGNGAEVEIGSTVADADGAENDMEAGILDGQQQLATSAIATGGSQNTNQAPSQQFAEPEASKSGKMPDSEVGLLNRSSMILDKTVSEGEAEVTQQFKELSGKLQGSTQPSATPDKLNFALAGLEKPQMLRTGAVEATLLEKVVAPTDKTAISAPLAATVRGSVPSMTPQSAYVTNLQMPVRSPEWQQGMAQKLVWFVSEKIQSAKIHVSPPELGPVDLKIQVSKDQAQIQIQSPHAIVRDMLDGTAQRLREMMASQGIDLTSFDVGSQQQQADNRESTTASESHHDGIKGTSADSEETGGEENIELNQLVDYYV